MADHGYSLGQHGRFEKHCCYDPALRVPLIMRWPGRIARGVVTDFTESVDVGPTILDLLGAERFDIQHGQSLRAYVGGQARGETHGKRFSASISKTRKRACGPREWKFVQCSGQRARTDGYITDNPTPGRYYRLFDLKADPGEFHNVADQHPELVKKFSVGYAGGFPGDPSRSTPGAGETRRCGCHRLVSAPARCQAVPTCVVRMARHSRKGACQRRRSEALSWADQGKQTPGCEKEDTLMTTKPACLKTKWNGREAYTLHNDLVQMVTLPGGGHIAEFQFLAEHGIARPQSPLGSTLEVHRAHAISGGKTRRDLRPVE